MEALTTTLLHLPREVMYMILDNLSLEDRATCRLVNSFLMKTASYIFREVKITAREHIRFFQECLKQTPCIGSHVQKITFSNAALLRAVNQTQIKVACTNVKEIEITISQGRGSWAQHLKPYPHIQHPPELLDAVNAKIILDTFKQQMMTLRLGGKFLYSLSLQDIEDLVKTTPQIRTFGLHYLFKEKNKDIHRDLPHTLTFEDLNYLLKQPCLMTRFELQYCEVADTSLIAPNTADVDLLRQLRASRDSPVLYESSLLDTNNTMTHIEMKYVQVANVSHFVRSILDSFTHLQVLDLTFVNRDLSLELSVGSQWDLPPPDIWAKDFVQVPSRLRSLSLAETHSRLTVSDLLSALARARAPLQDLSIVNSDDRENVSMDVICDRFINTLQSLKIDCKSAFGLDKLGALVHLKSAKLHWTHSHFEMPVCPGKLLRSSPGLTELELGYNRWYSHMIARPIDFAYEPYANITRLTLDRIVMNEDEMKEVMLPLINLKEAIFRRCMFESSKPTEEDEDYWDTEECQHDAVNMLDKEEMFDFMPSTGPLMDKVRENLFKLPGVQTTVKDTLKGTRNTNNGSDKVAEISEPVSSTQGPAFTTTLVESNAAPAPVPNHLLARAAMLMTRPINRNRPVKDPSKSKNNNFHIQSLSLEHLGIHDCKFREASGGMANARTIRNFQVIQDRRSGCVKSYDVDRAYHEKKGCNPHVILNKKTVTDTTIGFHYTHEFGGTTGKNDYINSRPTFKIRVFSLEKLSIRPNSLMSIYFTGSKGESLKTCNSLVKEYVDVSEANNGTYIVPPPTLPEISTVEDDRRYAKELMEIYKKKGFEETPVIAPSTKRENQEVEEVSQFLTRALDPHLAGSSRRYLDDPFRGNLFDRIRGMTDLFNTADDVDMDGMDGMEGMDDTEEWARDLNDTGLTNLYTLNGPSATAVAENTATTLNITGPDAAAASVTEQAPVFNKYLFDSDIFKSVVFDTCEYSRNQRRSSLPRPGSNKKTMSIRPF